MQCCCSSSQTCHGYACELAQAAKGRVKCNEGEGRQFGLGARVGREPRDARTLIRESLLAETRRPPVPPPGMKATAVTASLCPRRRYSPASATTSHTMMSVSNAPDARSVPSSLKDSAATDARCPSRATRIASESRSQRRTLPSWWPTATRRLLEEHTRDETSVAPSASRSSATRAPCIIHATLSAQEGAGGQPGLADDAPCGGSTKPRRRVTQRRRGSPMRRPIVRRCKWSMRLNQECPFRRAGSAGTPSPCWPRSLFAPSPLLAQART